MSKATPLRLGILLAAVVLALSCVLPLAYADGDGVISGKVQNKTAGGSSTSGMQVTLRTFAHQSESDPSTVIVDADGNYRFEKLSTANTYAYSVSVNYRDVTYPSDLVVFKDGQISASADIAVYETTSEPQTINIDRAHVIVDVNPETKTLPVTEILVIANPTDRTFVAADHAKGTLHVTIPAAANNLQLEPNLADNSMALDNGFIYAGPLLPGSSQLMYAYELPYTGGSYDLLRSFDYPVQQLSFLMPDRGVKLSSQALAAQEPLKLSDQSPPFLHLLGDNVSAGTPVTVHLEGLPFPSPWSLLSRLPYWSLPAAIAVLLLAIAALWIMRKRRASTHQEPLVEDAPFDEDFEDADEDLIADEEDEPEGAEIHRRQQ